MVFFKNHKGKIDLVYYISKGRCFVELEKSIVAIIIWFWNNNQKGQIIPLNYKNFEFKLKKHPN